MLDSIRQLCEEGFAIHWLYPRAKNPIGDDWAAKPVASFEKLKRSYRQGMNVGVRLGKWSRIGDLYLHVIDLDIRDASLSDEARAELRKMISEFEDLPSVISGSGGESRHYYFLSEEAFPPKKLAHSAGKVLGKDDKKHWAWEIELFGTGKQVAIPPSIHPDTGKRYRWEREIDFDAIILGVGPVVEADRIRELIGREREIDIQSGDGEDRSKPLGLTVSEIQHTLKGLPVEYWRDDREGWLTVGFAIHHETGGSQEGFQLWRDFSASSDKFDTSDQRRVWKSFRNKPRPIRMATLMTAAREARLEAEFENLDDAEDDEDDFDDLDRPAKPKPKKPDYSSVLGGPRDAEPEEEDDADDSDDEDVPPRVVKLRKADVEAELGHVPPKVKRMNAKHAIAFVKGKCVIITEHDDGTTSYGTQADLHAWYENDRVATEKSTEPVSKAWMRHKKRRDYPNGVVFAPGRDVAGAYNHWKGFSVIPNNKYSCALWLAHLRDVICSGDETNYRYALGWFAHLVQRPEEKPGVAMILRGKKRIGKDTIADYFANIITHHRVKIANQDQLVGKFNAHQEKCLFLHVEEGFWAGNKNADGVLKNLITSEQVLIEPKGINPFNVDSCLRLFMSSNEEWIVPATADEGRYFVLDVSEARRNDHVYFAALRKEMKNGGPEALLWYLQHYDISDFQVRKVPNTAALTQQKLAGLKNLDRWWFEMLDTADLSFEHYVAGGRTADWSSDHVHVDRDDLFDSYNRWIHGRRYDGDALSGPLLGKRLQEIIGDKLQACYPRRGKSRIRQYIIPPLEICRRAFERYLNSEIKWDVPAKVVDADELDEDMDDEYDDLDQDKM
ncbi:hypothetical protein HDIA_0712 [Hartmannibacter diazotrophicus]|uniref:DNA primase/polymerase bifunctional N-terminal domain-containing protein n=1 Tax=Hartmannibacter diazotrophicus TaxID=1482074 RepID=A0A2C9D209_9HYPH|nr:DUF5906 domain-containing protein [Hartmannibacter diazotrophicus]SON54253.1 hypothetical protein HDIA_0712 [Hartmannibacter diazotrophicus]